MAGKKIFNWFQTFKGIRRKKREWSNVKRCELEQNGGKTQENTPVAEMISTDFPAGEFGTKIEKGLSGLVKSARARHSARAGQ